MSKQKGVWTVSVKWLVSGKKQTQMKEGSKVSLFEASLEIFYSPFEAEEEEKSHVIAKVSTCYPSCWGDA